MNREEIEKMFLDLNSVLVKFWIERGKPDKEIKIELLERMLNWYKKMGYITLDEQSKGPVNEDLEEAAEKYVERVWLFGESWMDVTKDTFKAGAEWQKEQMGEQARKELFKDDLTLADLVAFDEGCKIGRRLERQDMLREAVEGVMIDSLRVQIMAPLNAVIQREGLKDGDKMKILIMKEEQK